MSVSNKKDETEIQDDNFFIMNVRVHKFDCLTFKGKRGVLRLKSRHGKAINYRIPKDRDGTRVNEYRNSPT